MKKLIVAFLITITSTHAFILRECKNENLRDSEAVSFQFLNCMKHNFFLIETSLNENLRIENCHNISRNRVSPNYIHCINNNFDEVAFKLPGSFVRSCFQFDRNQLEPRFIDCINENFENIERELRWRR